MIEHPCILFRVQYVHPVYNWRSYGLGRCNNYYFLVQKFLLNGKNTCKGERKRQNSDGEMAGAGENRDKATWSKKRAQQGPPLIGQKQLLSKILINFPVAPYSHSEQHFLVSWSITIDRTVVSKLICQQAKCQQYNE